MYRESIRKFYETEVAPFHSEWEKQGEVPRELWTKVSWKGASGDISVVGDLRLSVYLSLLPLSDVRTRWYTQ